MLVQVLDEVLLGLELPLQLLGLDVRERTLLALLYLRAVHILVFLRFIILLRLCNSIDTSTGLCSEYVRDFDFGNSNIDQKNGAAVL